MHTTEITESLTTLFAELVNGAKAGGGAYMLNSGDRGLLRSLETLSAAEASRSLDGGATIAAHAQHLRYGLSLMNRWASEGGDPFADATWDEAWKTRSVDDQGWREIQAGLRDETGLPVLVAENPLTSVVLGAGKMLSDLNLLRKVSSE